jgi:hypothetical protein
VAFPYFFFLEVFGPIIEGLGYLTFIAAGDGLEAGRREGMGSHGAKGLPGLASRPGVNAEGLGSETSAGVRSFGAPDLP